MNIVEIEIDKITPYRKNAKKHDKTQINNVAESIKQFGMVQPLVIDRNNEIIIGHCRFEACKELGYKTVPCVKAEELNRVQVEKLRLLDNKLNESEWDVELLQELVPELDLSDFDLEWGIPELETEEKEVEEDNYDIEEHLPENPKAKLGDIYQLGEHRLMCGDSTKAEDVEKLMGDSIADLVVTDPPYNVDIQNSDGLKIENDNMSNEAFEDFLDKCFANIYNAMKEGASFYVWHASRTQREFETSLNKAGLQVRQQLIWNKNRIVMGRQDYQWKHEGCVYGWKDGASHYFIDDRTQTTVIEDKGLDFKKMKKEELVQLLKDIYSDKISSTIINEDKPSKNDLHPTMKPIKLIARLIKNSSKSGWNVLDLFGGSGSTLITCEQLGRKCYTMEFDPRYADVIINRWETYTGKKAIKLN